MFARYIENRHKNSKKTKKQLQHQAHLCISLERILHVQSLHISEEIKKNSIIPSILSPYESLIAQTNCEQTKKCLFSNRHRKKNNSSFRVLRIWVCFSKKKNYLIFTIKSNKFSILVFDLHHISDTVIYFGNWPQPPKCKIIIRNKWIVGSSEKTLSAQYISVYNNNNK